MKKNCTFKLADEKKCLITKKNHSPPPHFKWSPLIRHIIPNSVSSFFMATLKTTIGHYNVKYIDIIITPIYVTVRSRFVMVNINVTTSLKGH